MLARPQLDVAAQLLSAMAAGGRVQVTVAATEAQSTHQHLEGHASAIARSDDGVLRLLLAVGFSEREPVELRIPLERIAAVEPVNDREKGPRTASGTQRHSPSTPTLAFDAPRIERTSSTRR